MKFQTRRRAAGALWMARRAIATAMAPVQPPVDQLKARAEQILTDGRRHSPQALRWAQQLARPLPCIEPAQEVLAGELQAHPFTLRELSLGAER